MMVTSRVTAMNPKEQLDMLVYASAEVSENVITQI